MSTCRGGRRGPVGERPDRLVVVTGTGTEVGKTWVATALLGAARAAGLRVAARKPAQSFDAADPTTDAEVLAAASGEAPELVCPAHRHYALPLAPFMAAARLGRPPFVLADLLAELQWPEGVDLGLLEGAGGVCSPIASDGGDTADLVRALRPDVVVLVADAGLGTINATRLALAPLPDGEVVVFLNRFDGGDDLHAGNRDWLLDHLRCPVEVDIEGLLRRALAPGRRG